MFRYYLKLGTLSIRANPALSALMVAAIAIGIGACMTIVTVRHVMSGNPISDKNDVLFHVQLDNWDPEDPYDEPNEPPQLGAEHCHRTLDQDRGGSRWTGWRRRRDRPAAHQPLPPQQCLRRGWCFFLLGFTYNFC